MILMNFGPLALKMFLPLGAMMMAADVGTLDWAGLIERWGIAGVWALVAYVLWKKQEKSDLVRMKLQEENHKLQVESMIQMHSLQVEQLKAAQATASALGDLAIEIKKNKESIGGKIDQLTNEVSNT